MEKELLYHFYNILIVFFICVKSEEIERVFGLLKDESSDHLTILQDLNKLLDICLNLTLSKVI